MLAVSLKERAGAMQRTQKSPGSYRSILPAPHLCDEFLHLNHKQGITASSCILSRINKLSKISLQGPYMVQALDRSIHKAGISQIREATDSLLAFIYRLLIRFLKIPEEISKNLNLVAFIFSYITI